jgi:hypothetical protein
VTLSGTLDPWIGPHGKAEAAQTTRAAQTS